MKKMFCIALILFLSFILCFSIPKPKENSGSLIGKTYIELDKDWKDMSAGKYYKVQVIMFNKATKKKLTVMANKDGIFYFLNLVPGEYVITNTSYQFNVGNTTYSVGGSFGKTGYEVVINSNKITALKTIGVLRELLPVEESRDKITPEHSLQRMNQKIVREENLEELKEFFKNLDNKNQWANFEWVYEGK